MPDLAFEDVVEDLEISSYYGVDVAISIPNEDLWPSEARTLRKDGRYVIYRDGWGRVMRGIPGAEFAAEEVESVLKRKGDLDGLAFATEEAIKFCQRLCQRHDRRLGLYNGRYAATRLVLTFCLQCWFPRIPS